MTYLRKSRLELQAATTAPIAVLLLCLSFLSLFVLSVRAGPVERAVDAAIEAADRGIRFSDAAWVFLSCFLLTLIAFVVTVRRMTDILLRLSTRPCISQYLRERERLEQLKESNK